jgi:transposase
MSVVASEERLFDVPVVESTEVAGEPKAPVEKTFRRYDPHQVFLLPPSIEDWVPEGHLARFVSELVDEVLDLGPFLAAYTEVRGYPPYDPRLMLKLLIYGYVTGVRSSRAIERRCHDDVAFRFLAANQAPDYRSIARFRRRHLKALEGLFLEALGLCRAAGMVKLGRVALDGTKVRANASRRKAMSYERMGEREAALQAEVDALLADAEATDAAEDAEFGPDNRGDDLQGELARRETRLAKIRKAKADLEAEAREKAAEKAAERARRSGADEAEVADAAARAADEAVPDPKAQRNFTDPDSRIMKTSDGSFHQCFNGQAVVDEAHQVIVASDLHNCAADAPSLAPMLDATIANCGQTPREFLADAGYFSEDNANAAAERAVDAFIATGRLKHHDTPPPTPRGRIPADATVKDRMARKLRTKKGKAAYARRKAIVEPVFGQMQTLQDGDRLLLRGTEAARAEWNLINACHNLRKLFGFTGTANLATA